MRTLSLVLLSLLFAGTALATNSDIQTIEEITGGNAWETSASHWRIVVLSSSAHNEGEYLYYDIEKTGQDYIVTNVDYEWFIYPSHAEVKINLKEGTYHRTSRINLDIPVKVEAEIDVLGGELSMNKINDLKSLVRVKSMSMSAECLYPEAQRCIEKAAEISKTNMQCTGLIEYCPTLPVFDNWLRF